MSNTTRFNEELCQEVRSGKLAIENTDKERIVELIYHIFGDDGFPCAGDSDFYFQRSGDWYGWENSNGKPTRPVSDFFLPAVSDGKEGKIIGWSKEQENYIFLSEAEEAYNAGIQEGFDRVLAVNNNKSRFYVEFNEWYKSYKEKNEPSNIPDDYPQNNEQYINP